VQKVAQYRQKAEKGLILYTVYINRPLFVGNGKSANHFPSFPTFINRTYGIV
jgi:hypothetical protein